MDIEHSGSPLPTADQTIHRNMSNFTGIYINSSSSSSSSNQSAIVDTNYSNGSNFNILLYNQSNGGSTVPFFEHYFAKERFTAECILAGVAILINVLAFFTSRLQHHQHYAYYALFKNLTFANAMFCLFNWLSNNILIIFEDYVNIDNLCMIISLMTIALIATALFGLISTSTLLGFSLVHYFAVCHPLSYPARVNQRSVNIAMATVWGILLILAAIPIIILISHNLANCAEDKSDFIESLTQTFVNISVALLQFTILLILGFCLRIHIEIKLLQSRLSFYCWVDEMELERRTFRSILLLVCTLILFYLPFTIVFVVSNNQDTVDMINTRAIVFYMTLMPYLKFCTDPILYKKSLMDFSAGVQVFVSMCLCYPCCCGDRKGRRSSLITTRLTRLSSKRENRGRVMTVL